MFAPFSSLSTLVHVQCVCNDNIAGIDMDELQVALDELEKPAASVQRIARGRKARPQVAAATQADAPGEGGNNLDYLSSGFLLELAAKQEAKAALKAKKSKAVMSLPSKLGEALEKRLAESGDGVNREAATKATATELFRVIDKNGVHTCACACACTRACARARATHARGHGTPAHGHVRAFVHEHHMQEMASSPRWNFGRRCGITLG